MEATLYIATTNEVRPVTPENGTDFSSEEINSFVEGHFEIVSLNEIDEDDLIMILNEEGKLNGLHYNVHATDIWCKYHGLTDYIVGNALVCLRSMVK